MFRSLFRALGKPGRRFRGTASAAYRWHNSWLLVRGACIATDIIDHTGGVRRATTMFDSQSTVELPDGQYLVVVAGDTQNIELGGNACPADAATPLRRTL